MNIESIPRTVKSIKIRKGLLAVVAGAALLASSCATRNEYAYVKDAPRDEEMPIINNYTTTIFVGDVLDIHVSSGTPQSTYPFNEDTRRATRVPGSKKVVNDSKIIGYQVAPNGTIHFPQLGDIPAAGLTLNELARSIEGRLIEGRYVKDPSVTVTMPNFHVTVVGEVSRPMMIPVVGNRITILEALAICGDVTMDGLRDNVKVIRFETEMPTVGEIDLTSKSAFDSPYYYLKQNDIVYIEPTPKKKRLAYRDKDVPRYISTGVSAVSAAYTWVRILLFDERHK